MEGVIGHLLKNNKLLKYLFFVSIVIKLIILMVLGAQPFMDGKAYMKIAETIFNNNFVFPNHELDDMPLVPYIYSLFFPLKQYIGISAYAIPNIILASMTIFILYSITFLIFESTVVANIAAVITTFYPFFNFYSISILTETIFIFFLYVSLFYAVRFVKYLSLRDIALFSIFFALTSFARPITVPMFPFFLVLFSFVLYKQGKKDFILKSIVVSLVIFYTILSPWIIRNYAITNDIVTTTPSPNGNFAFYIGNNPLNKTGGGLGSDFSLLKYEDIDDINKASEMALNDAIVWIKDNPLDWVVLEYRKFIRFYRITLHAKPYQAIHYKLLSIFSYGVVLVLFLYGVFLVRDKFWLYSPMLLFSLLLTGVHMVLFASVRYRLPIEPFMIIISSYVIYNIMGKFFIEYDEKNFL